MKLRKTLGIIMAAVLTVGTMAGCSQATQNYIKEVNNVEKWESTTSDITGTVGVDAQGIKQDISFTCTAYKAKENEYADIKFKDPNGKINIPELKLYCDENTIYINKSFLEGIYTSTGQAVPNELTNIKEEYIGTDVNSNNAKTNANVEQIKALANDPDALMKLGKLIFGENNDLDLPYVQNGREYTLYLDGNQTVDLAAKAIIAGANNLDNLNSNFKLKLTAEQIAEAKKEINNTNFTSKLAEIKMALNGTSISSKNTFTDNSYTSDFNMNLQVKDFGKLYFGMKSTTSKTEGKVVEMPASKIKLTEEEFDKMLGVSTTAKATIPAATGTSIK
ncbi:hypothetical protein [Clostridium saccharoperbutylacetonicum]|uniref:hypothetical protein n=1 Tax=Clostridium saccharoperbutylacetonicum TaxID=36745 RepID=UPI000983BBBA|nr:hypothetical protein [Clostridium saccharoperbutylacetonicum]AQR97068.1 hypothetical protein CLSAP_43920 [Clostridium saccharoperbutylacetonicum]NSB32948.1 hypothetical protein [Clostridium saccharoperbutylacetonicum]